MTYPESDPVCKLPRMRTASSDGRSTRAARAAALGAVVLVATGCGASSSTAGSMTPAQMAAMGSPSPASTGLQSAGAWDPSKLPDPCRTIEPPDVTAVLGVAVTRTSNLESWPPLCVFTLAGGKELLYVSDNSQPSGRSDFDNERSISAGAQAIDGLGDMAFWVPDANELDVMTGRTHVVVKFGGSAPPAAAKEKAVSVGRIVVPRAKA